MDMKIEKDVPAPIRGKGRWGILKTMSVGDSVLCESKRDSIIGAAIYAFGKGNYATRAEGDKFRLWRLK